RGVERARLGLAEDDVAGARGDGSMDLRALGAVKAPTLGFRHAALAGVHADVRAIAPVAVAGVEDRHGSGTRDGEEPRDRLDGRDRGLAAGRRIVVARPGGRADHVVLDVDHQHCRPGAEPDPAAEPGRGDALTLLVGEQLVPGGYDSRLATHGIAE